MAPNLPPLLLSGFMGTGKSTVGRIVAERAGVPFVDLDEAIEQEAGASIAAIFAGDGEASFRSLEASVLRRVLDEPGARVVALGGGALLDPASRLAAIERARIVTLLADPETIAHRTAGTARPLLEIAPTPFVISARLARIRDLLARRAPAYAEAHAQIRTDGRTPDAVAAAVHQAWLEQTHLVPLGLRSYPVRITSRAPEALSELALALHPSAVYLITDTTVRDLWGAALLRDLEGVPVALSIPIEPGEPSKRLAVIEHLLSTLIAAGADRDALILAHGGGVVSDIAGFTAATLFRGVRWAAVPTSLLAMVDASIGGKTGVDLGEAKNAVGAFHQPSAVFIDPAHVATETSRAYRSGLAEVVKSACVGDAPLFDLLEREADAALARDPLLVAELVSRSAALKVSIIGRDERESGDRAFLNFGHTLGHALEAQGGYSRLTHGEAVSLGMVGALLVGRDLGVTEPTAVDRVIRLLARLGLPTDLAAEPVADAIRLLARDKKRRGSTLRAVLLRRIGEPLLHRIDVGDLGARYLRAAAARP
jgi:shikimate kinase/3-dehydroquinate synthase